MKCQDINSKLPLNIDKMHTTKLGYERITRNLKLNEDAVEYLKNKILDKNCIIHKEGKNYYCYIDNIIITINAYNYCIITAHLVKSRKKFQVYGKREMRELQSDFDLLMKSLPININDNK